jgi:RNA polymerase sigma factor (sigma-70 family)
MSEHGSPPDARKEGCDGPEKENPPVADDMAVLRRHVANEIRRHFPGIDHDSVLKRAASITGDLAGAEDVRQSFYAGLLQLSAVQRAHIRSLDGYVHVAVRNLALRWRNTYRPSNQGGLDAQFSKENVEDLAERVADENEINFMLNQLPENCREGFVYYFAEDCTADEVAARLGIRAEAFKKRLQQAMLTLANARIAYAERKK